MGGANLDHAVGVPDAVALPTHASLTSHCDHRPLHVPASQSWVALDCRQVGGASNFMIAAARLGQRVASVGQLGEDVYGAFFRRVMQVPAAAHLWRRLSACTQWNASACSTCATCPQDDAAYSSWRLRLLWGLRWIGLAVRVEQPTHASCHFHPQEEGVNTIEALSPEAARKFATLLCFVLVSPAGGHAFTSAYDFGPWPLLAGVADLQPRVLEVSNHRVSVIQ